MGERVIMVGGDSAGRYVEVTIPEPVVALKRFEPHCNVIDESADAIPDFRSHTESYYFRLVGLSSGTVIRAYLCESVTKENLATEVERALASEQES